ncbi:MAG TPA: alpha/beta fold hydrolase [Xanthobacteraceae bacterium]|jgi:3-oxoadipate enol-lactonase|nr:alpha/beta fold hydrolase [Xanthobacteraceae bacterium]
MPVSKIRVRDGAQLAYEVKGRVQDAAPLVLIHSLAMDHTFWNAVARALSDATAVVTYDCRGHGQSDKPEGPYRVEQFADDLADLLDHLGWRSAIVAGASMGGCVALAFAAAYPARAAALGLFDTTACYNAPDKWEERAAMAEARGLEAMLEFQTTRWFTDAFRASRKDVLDAAIAVFLANPARCYAQTCRMLGACNLTDVLQRLKMPVRIVVGEEDYATPIAMSEALHRGIAGSTLTVIPNARHLTPLECPERIVAELQKLVEMAPAQ